MAVLWGLALVVWAVALFNCARLTLYACRRLGTSRSGARENFQAFSPISILKPLCGIDPGLEQNLEAFFRLDYPELELLFCVADESDPAAEIVRKLQARYPKVPATLFFAPSRLGFNPKINNLAPAYETARHEWLLFSDSNVRPSPDYLTTMMAELEPDTGLLSVLLCGREAEGLGGKLAAMFLNTLYARGTLGSELVGRPPAQGKSMLIRRSVVERFGGLPVMANVHADDIRAGMEVTKLGLKVQLMRDPLAQTIGRSSFATFWSRNLRWGRSRRGRFPLFFAIEPLFGSLVSGLLGAAALHHFFGLDIGLVIGLHLAAWFLCDLVLIRLVSRELSWDTPWYWALRQALALPLWLHTAFVNRIDWRGNELDFRNDVRASGW